MLYSLGMHAWNRLRQARRKRRAAAARRQARKPRTLESLEPRLVLATGPLVISEFMAENHNGLVDDYGNTSDWIEIYNPTANAVPLAGWYLTDTVANPTEWQFPSGSVAPGGYLVVFASGKDGVGPAGNLHTNFQLSKKGEYLALVQPDGVTAACEYLPTFPDQQEDVSYGLLQNVTNLVDAKAPANYRVPTSDDAGLGTGWTATTYSDAAWTRSAPTGLGYDTRGATIGVKVYKANVPVPDLVTAQQVIATPSMQTSTATENAPYINYYGNGADGHFTGNRTFPGVAANATWYVTEATGNVIIPTAGNWTFGVSSDDGFSLELTNGTSTFTSNYESTRTAADTLKTFNITTPGAYRLHLIGYQNAAGSELELFAASGSYTAYSTAFKLVGNTAAGGLKLSPLGDAVQTDVKTAMYNVNSSVWTRVPFQVTTTAGIESLTLRMKYSDGFVAYLNGQEIARASAPAGDPAWNSASTNISDRNDLDTTTYQDFNVTQYLGLLQTGTNVLAIQGLSRSVADGNFVVLPQLTATTTQADQQRYFASPTPGSANASATALYVADTKFSVDRGFYTQAFTLAITTATAGATIRYTTDGSTPTTTAGTIYTAPITVNKTTVVRTIAYKTGYTSTNVDTATYLFLTDVITQSGSTIPGPGWPASGSTVNSQRIKYGLDTGITTSTTWGPQLIGALKQIPTISIVTDAANLFNASTGIYVNAGQDTAAWERPASIELINPDGSDGFQINAGLRIRGGYSRSGDNYKHAFRLFFNDPVDGDLEYPLFGDNGAQSFGKIDLRCSQNYSWSWSGGGDSNNAIVRDGFSRLLLGKMGDAYTRSEPYHLYIDGQYWGLYETEERAEANFAASYFGGTSDDYDVIKVGNGYDGSYTIYATDGNMAAWTQLWQLAQAGFASAGAYQNVQGIPRTITSIARSGAIATVTLPGHAFLTGQQITIAGAAQPEYNGVFTITSTGVNTFTYTVTGSPASPATPAAGKTLTAKAPGLLDVKGLIDYMMTVLWSGDMDSPISNFLGNNNPNNWFGMRNRNTDQGFVFVRHDAEHTLSRADAIAGGVGNANRNGPWAAGTTDVSTSSPQYIHEELMANADYRMLFADRAQKYLLDNGLLTPAVAASIYQGRADEINLAVIAESARWGNTSLTKDTWQAAINYDLNYFINANSSIGYAGRAAVLLNQLKNTVLLPRDGGTSAPLYPSTAPADYYTSQGALLHGGQVEPGYKLTIKATSNPPAGKTYTIYYSLDGADPRLPGGALNTSPSVKTYTGPVTISKSTLVRARILCSDGVWSAINDAQFYVGEAAAQGNLAITEINYNPSAPTPAETLINPDFTSDSFEFIEFCNTSGVKIDLTGAHFSNGISFDFTGSAVTELWPGQYVVIVANRNAFQARYGGDVLVAGEFTGSLNNAGERLTMLDRSGNTIVDFSYNDSGSWPGRADGNGSTLVVEDTAGNYDSGNNWKSSTAYGGTPGQAGLGAATDVVVNEVLPSPIAPAKAAIELYNTTSQAVSIGGWYLSDTSDNYQKFLIPDGTTIPGHGYVVFYDDAFNPGNGANPNDLVLNGAGGGDLWLLEADTSHKLKRFADHAQLGAAGAGVALGRSPNGTGEFLPLTTLTLEDANAAPVTGAIIINEIHYHPDVSTDAEFIELYNNGSQSYNLGGWALSNAVSYTFPTNTVLAAGAYLVISDNPTALQNKFHIASLGPFSGKLSNGGDHVELRDLFGVLQDEVNYGVTFPWPSVGDPPGYSIELVNPNLDNSLGGSWRRSSPENTGATPATLLAAGSSWKYLKGTSQPSLTWHNQTFDDSTWTQAPAPIGYGESFVATTLSDMRNSYSTVYLRTTFNVADPAQVGTLQLAAQYDGGFNVWINGTLALTVNTPAVDPANTATARAPSGSMQFTTFALPVPVSYLVAGSNTIAVQALNDNKVSNEVFLDAKLLAWSGAAHPTPGAVNVAYAVNAPPQVRQVSHAPQQPAAGQSVTITAKVTDPNGMGNVSVQYQLVDPGDYISVDDPRYVTQWTTLPMADDGANGDATAGDGIYTAVLPAALQANRRLVRYRISAADALGASVTAPLAGETQANFAYFVYNGVPAWSGANQPGTTSVVQYPAGVMSSVASYQLLSTSASIQAATWGQYQGDLFKWTGTLVYDGVVYDNIRFRAGDGSVTRDASGNNTLRYALGKNVWVFQFNVGYEFQARDNYGNPYAEKWDQLTLDACTQSADTYLRGDQGMFEAVASRLFDLAGVAALRNSFVTLRVIDDAAETGATQYDGDFWGLYLAVEPEDGAFLDGHSLGDGNLYNMDAASPDAGAGGGIKLNQGGGQAVDNSDLAAFTSGYTSVGTSNDQWYRDNFGLEDYYSFRAITEAVRNYNISANANYLYYRDPDTGRWSILPEYLDETWGDTMPGTSTGAEPFSTRVLARAPLSLQYRNRLRELRDLLFNSEQTGQLIDESAHFIYDATAGAAGSIVGADRAQWDYNPAMINTGYGVSLTKAGQGKYYAGGGSVTIPAPGGFAGMLQWMKNYIVTRASKIDSSILNADDSQVPAKPTLTYAGATGYPVDSLRFLASNYTSPSSTPPDAIEWRIARVTDPTAPGFDPDQPRYYEINSVWDSGPLAPYNTSVTIPGSELVIGGAYRVRVRMRDNLGRWGHWSNAVQLVASPAIGSLLSGLRVSEVNYAPPPPASGPYTANDFQFVELTNTGTQPISLKGVQFTQGVTFTFPDVSLPGGQQIVVVANTGAFQSRYGTSVNVAGAFTGSLGPSTHLTLTVSNAVFLDFTYGSSDPWPSRPNGKGSTLEIIDASGDYTAPANWRASNDYLGSPGRSGSDPATNPVVFNEVLSRAAAPLHNAIELYNKSAGPVIIGGWYLSDSGDNYLKYQIPAGMVLAAGEYKVLDEQDFGAAFTLSGTHGGDLWLMQTDASGNLARFDDHVQFGATAAGAPLGLWTNSQGKQSFVPLQVPTLGQANNTGGNGPSFGPVVISEIMYAPKSPLTSTETTAGFTSLDQMEYVEICNPSSTSFASLANWRLSGAVSYNFPSVQSLVAGQTLLVVPFDPANTAMLNAFKASTRYNFNTSNVKVLGPYTGSLADAGGMIQLWRPDTPPPQEPTYYPALLSDEVQYSNSMGALGNGESLQRTQFTAWGDEPASWTHAAVSTGANHFISGRYVFYNRSALDGRNAAAGVADDDAIATDKSPLPPGQQAAFQNYTNYSLGLNGIMVDIAGLASTSLSSSDFDFKVGNTADPGAWITAPAPTINVRSLAPGVNRVTLIWTDNAIQNQWVQVTVKATPTRTALPAADVFYFGNAIAETGNHATAPGANAEVDESDEAAVRANNAALPAAATSPYDFNRDRRVNATDELIARTNRRTGADALQLINLAGGAAAAGATLGGATAASPAIIAASTEPALVPASAPVQALTATPLSAMTTTSREVLAQATVARAVPPPLRAVAVAGPAPQGRKTAAPMAPLPADPRKVRDALLQSCRIEKVSNALAWLPGPDAFWPGRPARKAAAVSETVDRVLLLWQ